MSNFIKKILSFMLFFVSLFVFSYADDDFPYTLNTSDNTSTDTTVSDNGNSLKNIINPWDTNSTIWKISEAFLWNNISEKEHPIAFYVSMVLNYFMAILAFVSFIILVYGFMLVFTGKTDEWIKKWWKYIKITTISLIIIWVSWLFSMWIFHIYNWTLSST